MMGDEHLGERWFLMDHADNSRFLQSHNDGVRHRRDRRYALHLPGQTSFTEELVRTQNCDDGFLTLFRNDGDLHLAFMAIWSLRYLPMLRPSPTLARKDFGVNDGRGLIAMT
jgi:hypothetical protein